MLVTLFGIVTEVSPEQPLNAEPPMLVTLLGIAKEVNSLQSINAPLSILVTLLGIMTVDRIEQASKALVSIIVNPVKYCNSLKDVIELLPLNTLPNDVTEAASSSLSSPSPFVSQLATQRAFTFASANSIML